MISILLEMDGLRIGRIFRALRIRAERRQEDVARVAGVSRQAVAKAEAGRIDEMRLGTVLAIGRGLGANVDVSVRWRGEGLDRLLDETHAGLVDAVVALLVGLGWETAVEVSFAIRGERGSVDVVGSHRATGAIVIVEVKSVVPDAGGMLSTLDRKARLAPEIARQLGWPCRSVSRLLVVGDSSTTRRRVNALKSIFDSSFPLRGRDVRAWLAAPGAAISGILFVPFATGRGRRRGLAGRQRVRRARFGRLDA